ncbi:MAG: hypothetical protein AB8H80_18505 [Planctomycetota bacterium]
MSWFMRDGAASIDPLRRQQVDGDGPENVEVADGVVIERRRLFWLSAASVSALLFGAGSARGQGPKPQKDSERKKQERQQPASGELGFDEFLQQVFPLARRLVASDGKDEDAYLMTIAAALTRLRDPKAPLRDAMRSFAREHRQDGERFPLSAVSMKLKPGKGFAHHDHLDYNGVIFGVDGEARIRNYDFVGDVPAIDSGESFEVRETRDDLVLPGRISTLGRTRDNIHDLVAGKNGARLLDVFTFYSKKATSRFLDVEAKPRDAEARIHEASWRPRRR